MQHFADILSNLTLITYILSFTARSLFLFRKQPDSLIPTSILLVGVLLHLTALLMRTSFVGHAPMANLYETLLFFSFCTALATMTYGYSYRRFQIDVITLPVASLLLILAIRADHAFTPLFLALKTILFEIHVMASFAGYALFTVAFASSFFFLLKRNNDIKQSRSFEEITNSANLWGFSLFSFAMFSGAIWAYLAWGSYWFWEPKTIWSFILWFYFAGIVHGHYLKGWRGKRVAWMTIVGFGVVIFTYVGVGLLMKSSHNL